VDFDASGNFLLCADLGLDKLMVYRIDSETGKLSPNDPPYAALPPGAGPRHIAFHPNGKYLYVVNELNNTVMAFHWDGDKGIADSPSHVSTLPEGYDEQSHTAEIAVYPSGKWVYASNRGHDSIAVFSVDEDNGTLTLIGHGMLPGKTPRHFTIDPSGNWLLTGLQNSGSLSVFSVSPDSGLLEDTGKTVDVPNPVCVLFAR
jgi:6-phosphogluconolactonase